MAFRETVGAEAFELAESALGKLAFVTVVDHSLDQLVLEVRHAASEFEGGHRPPELVGFARGEAGRIGWRPAWLFLEQR